MTAFVYGLPLPAVAHVPGQTPRPADALFAPLKEGISEWMTPSELAASPAFAAGLDLLSRRYFWEAHELFEAVWMCLPPASAERHLLTALIQIANYGLKLRMGRTESAARIRRRIDASVSAAFLHRKGPIMTLSRTSIALRIRHAETPSQANAI